MAPIALASITHGANCHGVNCLGVNCPWHQLPGANCLASIAIYPIIWLDTGWIPASTGIRLRVDTQTGIWERGQNLRGSPPPPYPTLVYSIQMGHPIFQKKAPLLARIHQMNVPVSPSTRTFRKQRKGAHGANQNNAAKSRK